MQQQRSNVGQSIFSNEMPTQNINPNDVMMQNMMKMFQQQMISMMQSQSSGFDLEKFYMHKVNDMNQFYNQIKPEECQLQQSSQFINAYNPNKYYEEMQSNTNRQLHFDDLPAKQNYKNEFHDYTLKEDDLFNKYRNKQELNQKKPGSRIQDDTQSQYSHYEEDQRSVKQFEKEPSYQDYQKQATNFNKDKNEPYANQTAKSYNRNSFNDQAQDAQPQYTHPFDDIPLKSMKQNPYNEAAVKNKQLDEIPIKPTKSTPQQFEEIQQKPYERQNLKSQLNQFDEQPIKTAKFNQFDEQPIKPAKYDEQPIKSNKYNSFDEQPIKPAKFNQFDEQPIKPAKQNQFDEQPIKSSTKYNQFDEQPIKSKKQNQLDEFPIKPAQCNQFDEQPIKPTKYNQFDEQPIKPGKQFDEYPIKPNKQPSFDDQPIKSNKNAFDDIPINSIKNQSTFEDIPAKNNYKKPLEDNNFENNEQGGAVKKKPFLKKGTRQYLSNAQQRSDIAKKEHEEILKENNAASNPILQKEFHANKPKPQQRQESRQESKEPMKRAKRPETPKEQPKEQPKQKAVLQPKPKECFESQVSADSSKEYQFDDNDDWNEATAQQSKIASQYFGQKKDQKQKNTEKTEKIEKETEEEIVRKYVQEKIDNLNIEIAKFKSENEKVKKAKGKCDDQLKQLQREREEWEKQKENEKLQLEEWKEEEKKKMVREKRVLERQAKTTQNMPTRKEREEIESLKQQLQKMVEDQKCKDQKNKLSYDRIKKQNEELLQRNQELQAEVKALELRILEQKRPSQAQPIIAQSKSQQLQISKPIQQPLSSKKEPQQSTKMRGQSPVDVVQDPYQKHRSSIYDKKDNESDNEDYEENEENEENEEEVENPSEDEDYEDIMEKSTQQKVTTNQSKMKKYDLVEMQAEEIPFSIKNINTLISEQEFNYDQNRYYQSYQKNKNNPGKIVNQNVGPDGKISRQYANGKKEVVFHNGVKREVFPDGYVIVHFTNKDVKQTLPNGTIIYFFADASTTQITVANGPNIYRFSNQQIEIHFPDSTKEIRFGDGTEKYISAQGEEQTFFSDGIVQKIDSKKIKHIEYPNGNIDIVYPDGQKQRQFKK